MDAFQQGLSRGIPAEKAASFFVGLKSWQQLSPEDDRLMAECIKQAAIQLSPTLRKQAALERIAQIKQAAEESTHGGGKMSTPTPVEEGVPGESPEQAFIANEQAGLAAEEQNSSAYFQQLLGSLREELAQTQEQAQQAQAQAEQLSAQQQAHAQEIAGAQQEAQLAQSAALEQVQSANASATTAMQQAVDAENRALQAKANEAAAKIQQQQVRSQLFDLASQGLPGSEPELGGEGDAAGGMQPGQPPAAPGGETNGASGETIAASGETPQAGGETPNAGLNEAGQPANAEGMPGQEASAEQSAAVGPTALQPPDSSAGGAGAGSGTGPQSNSNGSGTSPLQDPTAKRQGQGSIKVGSYAKAVAFLEERRGRPLPEFGKEAGLRNWVVQKMLDTPEAKAHGKQLVRSAALASGAAGALGGYAGHRLADKNKEAGVNPALVGGLAGGALGLGLGALEATGHGPDLAKLRGKIDAQHAAMQQPGVRGFSKAFDLAWNRTLLTQGEAIQAHPVLGTLASGAAGAAMGAGLGQELPAALREAVSLHKKPARL